MTVRFTPLLSLALACLLALCLQPAAAADRQRGKGGGDDKGIIGAHAAAGIGTPRGGAVERPRGEQRRDRGRDQGRDRDNRRDWHDTGRRHHHGGYYADRGRSRASFGLYLGGPVYADPFWGPRPYYYSPWYYEPTPRTVIIEREPTVYIQRDAPQPAPAPAPQAAAPAAPQLWYYCPKPAGYYPYVPQCDQQWVPVDPRNLPPTRPAQ